MFAALKVRFIIVKEHSRLLQIKQNLIHIMTGVVLVIQISFEDNWKSYLFLFTNSLFKITKCSMHFLLCLEDCSGYLLQWLFHLWELINSWLLNEITRPACASRTWHSLSREDNVPGCAISFIVKVYSKEEATFENISSKLLCCFCCLLLLLLLLLLRLRLLCDQPYT